MDLAPEQTAEFRLWVAAAEASAIGYTLYLGCAVVSLVLLWKQRHTHRTLGHRMALPYTVIMLVMSSVDFGLAVWTTGDSMLSTVTGSVPQSLVACTMQNSVSSFFHIMPVFISDALLVYRAYVILGNSKLLMGGPILLFFSTIVLGVLTQLGCAPTSSGHTLLPQLTVKHLAIGVYSITILLNVILTLAIVGKLLPSAFMFSRSNPASKRAISVIGILAESAALYTVAGLAFAASLVMRSDLQIIFGSFFGVAVYLNSGMITLRIALGCAAVTGDRDSIRPLTQWRSGSGTTPDIERVSAEKTSIKA